MIKSGTTRHLTSGLDLLWYYPRPSPFQRFSSGSFFILSHPDLTSQQLPLL